MISLFKKRLCHAVGVLCPCVLCALLALPASGACADYTAGTPGGAGRVVTDPASGDRKVEVTAPPPAAQDQQETPVYVYPQAGRAHPPHGAKAPRSPRPASPRQ